MIFRYHVDYSDRIEIGKPIKKLTSLGNLTGEIISVDQPVIAIRHATYEEYVSYIKSQKDKVYLGFNRSEYKYVEVTTD